MIGIIRQLYEMTYHVLLHFDRARILGPSTMQTTSSITLTSSSLNCHRTRHHAEEPRIPKEESKQASKGLRVCVDPTGVIDPRYSHHCDAAVLAADQPTWTLERINLSRLGKQIDRPGLPFVGFLTTFQVEHAVKTVLGKLTPEIDRLLIEGKSPRRWRRKGSWRLDGRRGRITNPSIHADDLCVTGESQ
jgi:hypothetical protein